MNKLISQLIVFLFISFSIFSQEELGTGLILNQEKYEEVTESVPLVTRSYTRLPSSFSLKGYAPTPKSQGSQGSCVGWASAYGAKTISNAVKNNWKYDTDKINANTFSPSFVYNQIRINNKCQGAYISDAMRIMNNYGSAKLYDFPYDARTCANSPTSSAFSKAKNHKIQSYERLAKFDNPVNLVGKVKKALANKNPVVIGMFNYGRLSGPGELWTPPAEYKKGGGHAMVVVGYDDSKYNGAFEIMNSWGTKFRNKGFFWIRYNDFKKYIKTAYVLVDEEHKEDIKIDDDKNDNNTYVSKISGEMTLRLANNKDMPVSLANGASRNFNIVKASKTTYKVDESYTSGTQFRIYLQSKQRGYVYLIGYGSSDKSINKLYPFDNFSDYFNYTNSEIALPNEDYFIEFDNKPGRDVLCVLYSKEKLDINNIINRLRGSSGDFVSKVKKALSNKMFKGDNVSFSKNKIKFNASSSNVSAKIVPVFIEMNHQ